jgi:ADP-ribose pyrophosphatase YjhB (NUDIX family)
MPSVVRRAARAVLIDSELQLLLIKRSKEGQAVYWTAPGGGVEVEDASVEAALIRELREELGAEVSDVQQVFLVSRPAGDDGVVVQHFFVCVLVGLDLERRDGPEFEDSGRGSCELDRVGVGADGRLAVDLKPAELRTFIEANWIALLDAARALPGHT